jgi:hypothetical protein
MITLQKYALITENMYQYLSYLYLWNASMNIYTKLSAYETFFGGV